MEFSGVILGTVIPMYITAIFIIPYGLRLVGVSTIKYTKEVLLKTYPIAGLTALALYMARTVFTPSSIIETGILALFGMIIFWGMFYVFGMKDVEQQQLKRYVMLN